MKPEPIHEQLRRSLSADTEAKVVMVPRAFLDLLLTEWDEVRR